MSRQINLVRAAALEGFVSLVHSLGGEPSSLLQRAGLAIDSLNDPDRYLPYRNVIQAIELGASLPGVPDFGLRLARGQNLSFLGVLWLAIQSASSVREGLLIASRHIHYHAPGIAVMVRDGGEPSREQVELRFLLSDLGPVPQAIEHAVSHACRVVRVLSDDSVQPLAVHLRHAQLGSNLRYREGLGQLPRFGSDFDGLVMDAIAWRRSLPRQNAQLQEFVERFLATAAPQPDADLIVQVAQILRDQMHHGPVGLSAVARVLHLHPRTLQRRLSDEGRTFESLKDEARRNLARDLLAQTEIGLSQVAQLLEFADQSVLTRACQRWFAKSPSVLRREAVAGRGDARLD